MPLRHRYELAGRPQTDVDPLRGRLKCAHDHPAALCIDVRPEHGEWIAIARGDEGGDGGISRHGMTHSHADDLIEIGLRTADVDGQNRQDRQDRQD
jgi:hypothetical protein